MPLAGETHRGHGPSVDRGRRRRWGRSATCHRSRCAGCRPTLVPTSSASARCCSRCSPVGPPFRGDTAADTLSAILREDPPALMPTRGVPPELERIIRRCLEKAPPNRFQSADDLAFALEAVTVTPTAAADGRRRALRKRRARLLRAARHHRSRRDGRRPAAAWYSNPPTVDLAARTGSRRLRPRPRRPTTPRGRQMAAASPTTESVNGRSQIFVRSLDSDSPAQITHGSDDAGRPFWWPDASRVGFVSSGKSGR